MEAVRTARPKAAFDQYESPKVVLDAVEQWASGCYLLRETAAIREGRIDGLLVPTHWDALCPTGFLGIEVKVHRSDFLRGLNSGQFTRYTEQTNGLYLATVKGVCKSAEVPPGVGHLIATRRAGYGLVCVCRRHPVIQNRQFDEKMVWRVIFDLFDQFRRQDRERVEQLRQERERVNEHVLSAVCKAVSNIEQQCRAVPTK